MNEELLALLAKMQTGTATQEEIARLRELQDGMELEMQQLGPRGSNLDYNNELNLLNSRRKYLQAKLVRDKMISSGKWEQPDKEGEPASHFLYGDGDVEANIRETMLKNPDIFNEEDFKKIDSYGAEINKEVDKLSDKVFQSENIYLQGKEQQDAQSFFNEQLTKDLKEGRVLPSENPKRVPYLDTGTENYVPNFTKDAFGNNVKAATETSSNSQLTISPSDLDMLQKAMQQMYAKNQPSDINITQNIENYNPESGKLPTNKITGISKTPGTLQTNQNQLTEFKLPNTPFPLIYPGGSDLSTELYTLGRAIGSKPGSQGRALTGIGAGGAALMDIGRNIASGVGFEKRNQYIEDWLRQNKDKINFVANPTTKDNNTDGGVTEVKYGGTFRIGTFEEGGTSDMQPQMEQPQFQSKQQIQQEQPQQDQAGQMMQAVAQMLQQGATPQQAVQALVQQGVPQEQAIQIVQMVAQQMQQMMAQQQPQQQQVPQQQPQPEMVMKNGGLFDRKIGDTVTIKTSNGEKVTGKIKSIVNGKVILE